MSALTPAQREHSRCLGLVADDATAKRLSLHGFAPDGFGCYTRGTDAPRSLVNALAVCIAEAAEPVGGVYGAVLPCDQRSEGAEQAGEGGEGAGGHRATMQPPTAREQSP